jgi:hypothetical protein
LNSIISRENWLRGAVLSICLSYLSVPSASAQVLALDEVERGLAAIADPASAPIKCGTPLLHAAQQLREQLSPSAQQALDQLLAPKALDQTFLSLGGHFVIEYSIVGPDSVPVADGDSNGVPDYVEWAAEAMEDSWQKEITELGFATIPLAPGERYVVRMNESGNYYGSAFKSSTPGGTVIRLNRDFFAFYADFPGLIGEDPDGKVRGGLRVTAAHEFKHAIQYVRSEWSEPGGWSELDATFMEDVVFDQVNDYYNYLTNSGSPFTSPTTSLNFASYEDSTWEHFLMERWSLAVILRYAQRLGVVRGSELPPTSYLWAFGQEGLDWTASWGEYQAWNYSTGTRSNPGFGFSEAARFPVAPVVAVPNTNNYSSPVYSSAILSGRYHEIDNGTRVRKGEATLLFQGSAGTAWSGGLLLQRPGRTRFFPLMMSASVGSLTTTKVGVGDFDRVAVIAGNASVSGGSGTYSFQLTTTDIEVAVEKPTFGGLKGRYRQP